MCFLKKFFVQFKNVFSDSISFSYQFSLYINKIESMKKIERDFYSILCGLPRELHDFFNYIYIGIWLSYLYLHFTPVKCKFDRMQLSREDYYWPLPQLS